MKYFFQWFSTIEDFNRMINDPAFMNGERESPMGWRIQQTWIRPFRDYPDAVIVLWMKLSADR